MESSADEDRSVRRRHHVGAVVLATRESRDEPERAVAAEAEELAARREKHEIVGGERHQGDHMRQRAPARPATPGAGEQRCQVPEAARQRDCRVEGESEDQRAPIVFFAELLEAGGWPLLGLREERVGVVDDHEAAQPVERERPAAGEPAEPRRIERQPLVGREPPDPRPVLLAEEEVARSRVEREAPERRRRGDGQRDPDPRLTRQVHREIGVQGDAIDLGGGVPARAGAQDDEARPVRDELEGTRHPCRDEVAFGLRARRAGKRSRDEKHRPGEARRAPHGSPRRASLPSPAPTSWRPARRRTA